MDTYIGYRATNGYRAKGDLGYTRIQGYRGIQEEKGVTGFTEPANREFRG